MARLVVIGGGAAGMSAASAARRVAPKLDVAVFEAGGFAAYGMCGIPYLLAGIVPRAEDLLAYPPSEFRDHRGIDLRLGRRVSAIDAGAHQVHVAGTGPVGYDALVVAAGASPARPPSDLAGLDLSYAPPFAPVYDPVLAAALKADHAAHTAPAAPATPASPVTTGRAAPGGSA